MSWAEGWSAKSSGGVQSARGFGPAFLDRSTRAVAVGAGFDDVRTVWPQQAYARRGTAVPQLLFLGFRRPSSCLQLRDHSVEMRLVMAAQHRHRPFVTSRSGDPDGCDSRPVELPGDQQVRIAAIS